MLDRSCVENLCNLLHGNIMVAYSMQLENAGLSQHTQGNFTSCNMLREINCTLGFSYIYCYLEHNNHNVVANVPLPLHLEYRTKV